MTTRRRSLVAQAGEHFDLYSGDDACTLPLLAVGAVGVVGTTTHWTGPQFQQMIAAFDAGDVARHGGSTPAAAFVRLHQQR